MCEMFKHREKEKKQSTLSFLHFLPLRVNFLSRQKSPFLCMKIASLSGDLSRESSLAHLPRIYPAYEFDPRNPVSVFIASRDIFKEKRRTEGKKRRPQEANIQTAKGCNNNNRRSSISNQCSCRSIAWFLRFGSWSLSRSFIFWLALHADLLRNRVVELASHWGGIIICWS